MKFGEFINGGSCYRIDKIKTPTPWFNYLFNDDYYLEISQRGCGKSYSVEEYRRTPAFNADREFYVKWNNNIYPLLKGKATKYSCEHHIHKTVYHEEFEGFSTEITVFVPVSGSKEIWQVKVINKEGDSKNAEIYACFPFANIVFQELTCRYDREKEIFVKYCFPYYITYDEYDDCVKNQQFSYAKSSEPCDSFETCKRRYYGGDNPDDAPDMVKNGKGSEIITEYEDCVAAFCHKVVVDDEKAITYVLGNEKSENDILNVQCPDFEAELKKAEEKWQSYLDCFYVKDSNKHLEYLVNYWFKKQSIFLVRHNRGGVYCPVRNQLQDALGYAVIDAEVAYKYVLDVLHRQEDNGHLKQWYTTDGSPEFGLCRIVHSDAPIWLIICFAEIINEGKLFGKFQTVEKYYNSDKEDTVLDHLKNAARYMYSQRGEHGLCLLKDGDWNDPINGPGRLGRGESVWNTLALIYAIKRLAEVSGDTELMPMAEELSELVNKYCWDEDRYIVGFDDYGKPYGCKNDEEGSMFLNTQTWAMIAGICDDERLALVRKTIERESWSERGYRLIVPAFSKYNPTWGKISVKGAGATENGSIYVHGNLFKAYGDVRTNDLKGAKKTILSILPKLEAEIDNDIQIPTFIPNSYFGRDTDNFGRSTCFINSGAVGWLMLIYKNYFMDKEQ